MKFLKLFVSIILTLVISVPSFAQETGDFQLSLEECLEYAFEHNENLIIANLEMDVSRAKTREFLSTGYPQVEINGSVNQNLILRRSFLPADQFNPMAPKDSLIELAFGRPYDGDIGLSIRQMIFNGSYFVGIKASKTYQQLAIKDHIRTKIDVAELVTKAYYSVLVNQLSYQTVISNFQRLDSLVRETQVKYDNGMAELLELNRLKVEFNNIKTEKSNNKRAVEISEALLKYQMGMPVENKLEITDKLADLTFNVKEEIQQEYSYQRRIEYSKLQTNTELAQIEMKNNKAQYLPKLDISFAWGINAGASKFSDLGRFGDKTVWPDYQLIGLQLHIPVFDGLYKSNLIQQNKLKIKQLEFQRKMLQNSIKLEVEEHRKNLMNSIDQLNSQEENVKLAESVFNQSKIKYQEGVGSNLEVIDSDDAYTKAQNNYFNALYDALISHVDYQKALGIINIDY